MCVEFYTLDKVTARVSDDDGSGEAVPPDSISAVAPEENSDLSDEEMVSLEVWDSHQHTAAIGYLNMSCLLHCSNM